MLQQLRHLIYTKLGLLSFGQRVGPFIPTPGKERIIDAFSDGEAFLKKVHARQCPLRDKRVEKLPSFICKKTSIWGWGFTTFEQNYMINE